MARITGFDNGSPGRVSLLIITAVTAVVAGCGGGGNGGTGTPPSSASPGATNTTTTGTTSVPSVPSGVQASAGNASVALTWPAVSGATSYGVGRSTTSAGPWTQIGSPTTNSYSDSGLTNGTTYYYVVSAVDSAGASGTSTPVAATPATPTTGTPLKTAGYWHTSGNKIVDSNNAAVRMAGVNWYGFETTDHLVHGLWAQDYQSILNTVKALGYNVIRIPFSNEMVEKNPIPTNFTTNAGGKSVNTALVGQTALQDLDTIVAYAGSIGLRVILDNHRSEAGNSNEASGLWYTSTYPQASWVADWQMMAMRYSDAKFTFAGNPTVIGVDLRNEPHLIGSSATSGSCWTGDTAVSGCPASLTAQNWTVAAQTAGNAVLAVNPNLLIFVEGVDCYNNICGWQGGNLLGVASSPVVLDVSNQLVYSAHDYGPSLFRQSWFNSNTTMATLDEVWNKYWGYISVAGTAPVWLGEFGTGSAAAADVQSSIAGSQGQWFQGLVTYLQANPSISWTYWALNGEDSYGLLDSSYGTTPSSATKQSLLQSIQFGAPGSAVPAAAQPNR